MLSDLHPLLTATVRHYQPGPRSIHGGKQQLGDFTEHRARVSRAAGTVRGPASQDKAPLPSATVWLINHPREIALAHVFEITPGAPLDVIGFEVRDLDGGTITKVYLK